MSTSVTDLIPFSVASITSNACYILIISLLAHGRLKHPWQLSTKGTIQAFADSRKCHQEISLGHHTVLQPSHFHLASEGTCCSYYAPLLLLLRYFIHTVKLACNVSNALKKKKKKKCLSASVMFTQIFQEMLRNSKGKISHKICCPFFCSSCNFQPPATSS